MKTILFHKTYSDESLYDLPEDVGDACNPNFSPEYASLPEDEHRFKKGTFTVTITWHGDDP